MGEGRQRVGKRHAFPTGNQTDSHGIGKIARQFALIISSDRRACPGGVEKGSTLRHGLQMAFGRPSQSLGKVSEFIDHPVIGTGPPGLRNQHHVVPAGPMRDEIRQPVLKMIAAGDSAGIHGGFQSVTVAEAARRKGRRQPSHQPHQTASLVLGLSDDHGRDGADHANGNGRCLSRARDGHDGGHARSQRRHRRRLPDRKER
jgi:hypothetical protein